MSTAATINSDSNTALATSDLSAAAGSSSASVSLPAAYELSVETRRLFTEYYARFQDRQLSDGEIIDILQRAYNLAVAAYPYRCIKEMRFASPRMSRHPQYSTFIKDNPNKSSIYICDVGCCCGTDIRQLILDGIPADHIIGIDVEQAFIDIGLDVLFQDRHIIRSTFTRCNLLDEANVEAAHQIKEFLIKTNGGVDVLYAGSIYHLLTEDGGKLFTAQIARLLRPGGHMFGRTVGSVGAEPVTATRSDQLRFLHSKSSFTTLLTSYGFTDIHVSDVANDIPRLPGSDHRIGAGYEGHHNLGMLAFWARKA